MHIQIIVDMIIHKSNIQNGIVLLFSSDYQQKANIYSMCAGIHFPHPVRANYNRTQKYTSCTVSQYLTIWFYLLRTQQR